MFLFNKFFKKSQTPPPKHCTEHAWYYRLFTVLRLNLFNISRGTHDDWTPVVNAFRFNLKDSSELAVEHASWRHAVCVFCDHRHGKPFIQNSEFSFRRFFVRRIQKDTTVQQTAVDVGHLKKWWTIGPKAAVMLNLKIQNQKIGVSCWNKGGTKS